MSAMTKLRLVSTRTTPRLGCTRPGAHWACALAFASDMSAASTMNRSPSLQTGQRIHAGAERRHAALHAGFTALEAQPLYLNIFRIPSSATRPTARGGTTVSSSRRSVVIACSCNIFAQANQVDDGDFLAVHFSDAGQDLCAVQDVFVTNIITPPPPAHCLVPVRKT